MCAYRESSEVMHNLALSFHYKVLGIELSLPVLAVGTSVHLLALQSRIKVILSVVKPELWV